MTPFPPIVILNGRKNAVWKKQKTGPWHGVKNLLLWWQLTACLTTGIDPSHPFRMTINISLIMTADPSHSLRMTPCHEHRFHQQMKKLSKIRFSPSDSFLLSHISLPVPVFRIASSLFKICFSSSSPKKRPTGSPLSLKPCMVTSVPVWTNFP